MLVANIEITQYHYDLSRARHCDAGGRDGALVFGSLNALVLALFQHCYIWVYMYCTEAPDMRWIYGKA